MYWEMKHPKATMEHLGYIPDFLSESDPRSAREQLDSGYRHAGGWQPFQGFKMSSAGELLYPGDPPTRLIAETKLRGETIRLYEHSWVAVIQSDGSFEVCRMD